MFDFDWFDWDPTDYADTADVADTISSAVADSSSGGDWYDELLNNPTLDTIPTSEGGLDLTELLDDQGWETPSYGANLDDIPSEILNVAKQNGGYTGIGWIDKIIGRWADQFEKDPLATIGAGVGLVGKIDQILDQRKAKKAGTGAGGGALVQAGSPQAQAMIANLDNMANQTVSGANAPGPSLQQLQQQYNLIPITNAPSVRDPGLFVTQAPVMPQGPLSQIRR